jgi:hypothetical protein
VNAKIIRVPHLPTGVNVADLAKSVWRTPEFTVTEVDGITSFVFSVSLRDKMRSHNEPIYRSLFESQGPAWTTALAKAYSSARSGKTKTVARHIDTLLYTVFRGALQILMEDAKVLAGNYDEPLRTAFKASIDKETKDLESQAHRTKGRKRIGCIDMTRPIRLAERYATLKPLVSELKHFVEELKVSGVHTEETLRDRVRSIFKEHDWVNHVLDGCAFQEVPPNTRDMPPARSDLDGKWAPSQLTYGIISCEERKQRGRPVGALSISRLIARGKKLLEQFAHQ